MNHVEKENNIEDLMDKYGDSVLRMCYLYVKDYQIAEDITQETFIQVYLCYEQFEQASSIKTWILQIAINLCKNQIRKRWWKIRKHEIEYDKIIEAGVLDDIEKRLELEPVLKSIQYLSTKYKDVILLHYYQELKISEIAELLGEKETTIKSRLARARKQLEPVLRSEMCYE